MCHRTDNGMMHTDGYDGRQRNGLRLLKAPCRFMIRSTRMTTRKAGWLLFICSVMSLSIAAQATEAPTRFPTRFIVKWKDTRARAETLSLANQSLAARPQSALIKRRSLDAYMDVLQSEHRLTPTELATTLAQLRSDARVGYAVEDKRRHALALPDDPLFTATSNHPNGQWYLNLSSLNAAATNAVTAWDFSTGGNTGNGVIVAVVDTGVRLDHPDLNGKLLPGYDFVDCDQVNCSGAGLSFFTANDGNGWDNNPADPGDWINNSDLTNHPTIFSSDCTVSSSSWHGTRVASLVGAATDNGAGIAGMGWNARILPVRVLGKCGGYDSDIIAGMKWAAGLTVSGAPANANPAKVINLSLGSVDTCNNAYQDAINQILAQGINIVASAGNEGGPVDIPANCNGVISVVGVRHVGSKVGYSSLGSAATLAAPAGNCVNTSGPCLYSIDSATNLGTTTPSAYNPSDTTTYYTDATNANLGTSFSAPLVSGTVALMLGANNTLSPSVIRTRLQASSRAFPVISGVSACRIPFNSNDIQDAECNCTRNTCGAGLTDALGAVQNATSSIVPYIRGRTLAKINDTLMLDAAGSTLNDGMATYAWSIISNSAGASLSSTNGTSTSVTLTTAGSVTVQLNISDGMSGTSSLTHSITAYGLPTANITGPTSASTGQAITLNGSASSAQDGNALDYTWSVVSGSATLSTTNTASTTLTACTAGNVTIRLTVVDQEGGSTSANHMVTVSGAIGAGSGICGSQSSSSSSASSSGGGGGSIASFWLFMWFGIAALRQRQLRR